MDRLLKFFKQQLTLTHIYRIPVRIDYSWFLVFVALTWLSAISIPNSLVENYVAKFILGGSAILIFFVSIFLHEFAHAFIARREGIEVLEILLHPFGGLARLRREPDTPQAEFRIAIAGPIASFLIAFIFLGLWKADSGNTGHHRSAHRQNTWQYLSPGLTGNRPASTLSVPRRLCGPSSQRSRNDGS